MKALKLDAVLLEEGTHLSFDDCKDPSVRSAQTFLSPYTACPPNWLHAIILLVEASTVAVVLPSLLLMHLFQGSSTNKMLKLSKFSVLFLMITIKDLRGVTHTISFAVNVSKKVRCIKKLMDNTQYGDCCIL